MGVSLMTIDPVCHMEVDERSAPASAEHEGRTYYFWDYGCKKTFESDPEKYVPTAET